MVCSCGGDGLSRNVCWCVGDGLSRKDCWWARDGLSRNVCPRVNEGVSLMRDRVFWEHFRENFGRMGESMRADMVLEVDKFERKREVW